MSENQKEVQWGTEEGVVGRLAEEVRSEMSPKQLGHRKGPSFSQNVMGRIEGFIAERCCGLT